MVPRGERDAIIVCMNYFCAEETARCRIAQSAWAQIPLRKRLCCVRDLKHLLVRHSDELALTVTQEVGRAADEVLATDILPTADACRFLERNSMRILRPERVSRSDRPLWLFGSRDTIHRRPHGIVGIIGTWNYPILLNAVPIVHALAAGNGVLWKPSELTPMLGKALHDLFLAAGFPPDLFIRLPATREAGPALTEAEVNHVIFTGSAEVGRLVARRLGERLISSTLELSGCDAMIIGEDADLSMAAKAAWFGATLNRGQTCLAVRRIFVEQSRYAQFLDLLRPLAHSTESQPLLLWPQAQQAERLVRSAVEQGASLLTEGGMPRAEDDPPRFPRTFVVDARPEMSICREASFAPIAAVMPFQNLEAVIHAQTSCHFALGASIFMRDRTGALELATRLEAGMVTINDVIAPTAHPATPFGGRTASGWGSTQGIDGLRAMTTPQVISERRGNYRPHYATADGGNSSVTELLKGMLRWCHGGSYWQNAKGLWQMIRGARGTLRK